MSSFKQSSQDGVVLSEQVRFLTPKHYFETLGEVLLREKLRALSLVNTKLGLGPDLSPSQILKEFGMPDNDEAYQITHELTCGGKLIRLQPYRYLNTILPMTLYCHKCNTMELLGKPVKVEDKEQYKEPV